MGWILRLCTLLVLFFVVDVARSQKCIALDQTCEGDEGDFCFEDGEPGFICTPKTGGQSSGGGGQGTGASGGGGTVSGSGESSNALEKCTAAQKQDETPCQDNEVASVCDCSDEGDADCVRNICVRANVAAGNAPDGNEGSIFSKDKDIIDKTQAEFAQSRFFSINAPSIVGIPPWGPGRPDAKWCSLLKKPFPQNCKITRSTPYGENPPYNIPYCHRIPCDPTFNAPLDANKFACHQRPGCYFDYELYKYRQVFVGQRILPGVPVCHLAIRNRVFHEKARELPRWSSYFTHCLLDTFKEELEEQTNGCSMLDLLRNFKQHPKMAGWSNIQRDECRIAVNGCWDETRGCFYEIKLNELKIRSRQFRTDDKRSIDEQIPYGRTKCQNFNNRNPITILNSIHKCLISGCTLDIRVWNQYPDIFYELGKASTPFAHKAILQALEHAEVGPDNAAQAILSYENSAPKPPPPTDSSNMDSFLGVNFNSFPEEIFSPCGSRPCPWENYRKYGIVGQYKYPSFCPYKPLPFTLPSIGPLKGSFATCCDPPAQCYLRKAEIPRATSGVSQYYSDWTKYGLCSRSCGGGKQYRYRRCVARDRTRCTEALKEERSCNNNICASWGPYGGWGSCSRACGSGIQARFRKCFPNFINSECNGSDKQTRSCNTMMCDDRFGRWGPWDATCEPCGTKKKRTRRCNLFSNCLDHELVEEETCPIQCGRCENYPRWGPLARECSWTATGCKRTRRGQCLPNGSICKSDCIDEAQCPSIYC